MPFLTNFEPFVKIFIFIFLNLIIIAVIISRTIITVQNFKLLEGSGADFQKIDNLAEELEASSTIETNQFSNRAIGGFSLKKFHSQESIYNWLQSTIARLVFILYIEKTY